MRSVIFYLGLQVVLILINAVFACAEIALVSVSEARLAHLVAQGDPRAIRLSKLTSRPSRFLATIQVTVTFSGFLASAFAADHFADYLVTPLMNSGIPLDEGTLNAIVVILITVVLSFFTLIFGELVPKRIAMQKAEPLALALSGLVSGFSVVFSPIVSVLTICTNLILRLLGLDPNAVEEHHSKEDLQMMVDWGSQKGLFDCDTKEIISHALAFNDITVGEFSTHRTDIDILWTHQTTQDWARIILDTRHTRYPVCHETVDQVVGILDARDFFTMLTATVPEMLEALVKPAAFVLETLKADQLFKQMKGTRNYYAVVLDQHGGFRGVVTIRDLLEQLVGSIAPEGEATFIESLGPHLWRVRGSAHLEEVSRTLGVSLPHHQYETFGAYVFGLYGSIPPDGETFALTTDSLIIRVDTIQNHKLVSATVTRLDPS